MPASVPLTHSRPETLLAPSEPSELVTGARTRTLLYVGENPAAVTGSPVIVLRHLRRFAAAGWRIFIVGDYGGNFSECEAAGWTVVPIPRRRRWWPPYRDQIPVSRWLRLRLLASEIASKVPAVDVVFGYLAAHSDFTADLAIHVAQKCSAPLHMLAHDDAAAFPYAKGREAELRRRHDRILSSADVCWFVSPELAECYPRAKKNGRLLYPIPEGWNSPAVWRADLAQHSSIYYAGHLWPEQLPLMARIARSALTAHCELVVIARQSEALREFCLAESVRWQPHFAHNRQALAHLSADAAAVLVSYADTIADMPWSATSFPSKLVEYCHLGLPVVVVSHADSSVARWAKRVGFPYWFDPANGDALQAWFAGLKERTLWEERAAVSLRFARSEFNPERIQTQLAEAMTAGTESRTT